MITEAEKMEITELFDSDDAETQIDAYMQDFPVEKQTEIANFVLSLFLPPTSKDKENETPTP